MSEAADFEMQLDLTEVDAWGGESGPRVPPGIYDLEITSAEQGTSNKQAPVIKVEFTVLNEGEHNGHTILKSYSLQQKALGRLKNLLMACGARLDGVRSSEMVGRQIVAEVVHVQGDAQPQPDGSVKEGKMFTDVMNERAPEGAEEPAKAEPPKPEPVKTPAPTNAAKTTAVRRAVGSASPKA